jgi:hypothetical protein
MAGVSHVAGGRGRADYSGAVVERDLVAVTEPQIRQAVVEDRGATGKRFRAVLFEWRRTIVHDGLSWWVPEALKAIGRPADEAR